MNKVLKAANTVFYSLLVISLLLGIEVFILGILKSLHLFFEYIFILIIAPLLVLSLLIMLTHNIKKHGFISGIKESSITIFSLIICFILIWALQIYSFNKSNRINVTFINQSEQNISNITLIGRNATTQIDVLTPNQKRIAVFKGKKINYKTENDYENEIRLLYYFNHQWYEDKILSGFNRWRVIKGDWQIIIHGADSVEVKKNK